MGAQSATLLTYDSFWSSHSSAAGSWRRAIGSNGGAGAGGVMASASASSAAASGSGLGLGGSSAKA